MSFRPVLLAVLVACGGEAPDPNALPVAAPKAPQTTAPPVAPSHGANAAAATASGEAPHVGKALEVLEGGGYTYVKLGVGTAEVWIAGPKTAVIMMAISSAGKAKTRSLVRMMISSTRLP